MQKQAVLVFNPRSGRGKATVRAKNFADLWKEKFGNELGLRPTRSLHDIRVAAKEGAARGDFQIFMGGDGTLSESLQGLAEKLDFRPGIGPIGFLPGGTGNSFLRDFGITTYEQARDRLFEALESESILNVDSAVITYRKLNEDHPEEPGEKTRRIMFNIWGVGLISDITELAIKMRGIGSMNYTVASLVKMLGHKPWTVSGTIDGRPETFRGNMISLHNSRYTGGAMEIAPEVRINDGKLFFLHLHSETRLSLLKSFPSIFKGTHVSNPNVTTEFIKELKLERRRPFLMNVDGELETGWNPEVKIVPDFVKLYMPSSALA